MTMYTVEEIREKALDLGICATEEICSLLKELQRPSWMPDEGEVIVDPSGKLFRFGFAPNPPESAKFRRQNLKEHGSAVKALRDTMEKIACESEMKIPRGNGWTFTYSEMAGKALKAFDEVVK